MGIKDAQGVCFIKQDEDITKEQNYFNSHLHILKVITLVALVNNIWTN